MNPSRLLRSRIPRLSLAITLLAWSAATPTLFSASLDILVIGSTKSYSDAGPAGLESGVVQEKAFNPTTIATRLQNILSQDPAIADTVTVEFEDIYKSAQLVVPIGGSGSPWDMEFRCFSLVQHFMWPDGKAARMTKLQDSKWDCIVLCGDPYVMANFPGVYAEGVKLIQGEIAPTTQLILLGQWPEDGATASSAAAFNEIVHRVGDSAGILVAPGAKAWDSYTSKDSNSAHPTPRGQYLAAAAIYSKIYSRSASTSGYTYPSDGDNIADHVWSEVQDAAANDQYSGKYTIANAFQMEYYRGRTVDWTEYGTSTEEGFANGLKAALAEGKVSSDRRSASSSNPVDMFYSRGTDAFEPDKQYNYGTRLDNGNRVHGFPMGDHRGTASTEEGQLTMRYGIDKRYYANYWFYNGTDLGVAHSMVLEGEISQNVRGIPVRLLWSKMEHANLGLSSHRDGWHLSNELDRAVGAYLYTVLSGRCPVEAEPADNTSTAWKQWWCRKLGYETAWQMAHLTTRAPGFRVCPSSATALTLAPGATETMTVEFINPPQSDVTVSVSLSNSTAAIVGPKTLTFTPSNYSSPQQVIVAAIPGASAAESFEVQFATNSTDKIYDGLSDSWAYSTTRGSTVSVSQTDNGTTTATALQNTPLAINLNAASSNGSNTILVGPFHGSVSWSSDSVIEYTPDNGYLGSDLIVYAATVGSTQTIGCIDITVEVPNGQVNATVGDGSASEEGPDTGTFVISRLGGDTGSALNVLFSMSGSATFGSDYTLSHTSPVTIPAGQDSVTVTVTPVDDSVFGERFESVVLTITEDAAYPIGAASAIVTIADNDNNAPTANAGSDQSVEWQESSWVAGLEYGTVGGNIDVSTPNPATQILVDVSSETENSIAGDTTEIYTGQIYDADGQISFTEHIDDKARIWIDDVLVINNDAYGARSSTANLDLTPGWHDIEIRISNGGGGSGPPSGQIGIGYDPTGGTTWQTLTDPGDASFLRVQGDQAGGQTTLDGTASDIDDDPLTITWSVVSKPTNEAVVTFGDVNAIDPEVSFDTLGTYVLLLTVSDGLTEDTAQITILVYEPAGLPEVAVSASDAAASETGPDGGSFTITRSGDTSSSLAVEFAMSGSATFSSDYTLNAGSPVTIPAGQSSVVISLTPVDDSVFAEGPETATLTITADAAYTIGTAAVDVVIADNDNNAPTVDAGSNQTLYLGSSSAWTPADATVLAWYDANDALTITHNSGAVSQWDDKSGNGYHMKQASGSAQPAYTTSDSLFGGRPSISTGPSYKYLTMDQSIAVKRVYVVTYYGDGTQSTWSNHNALLGSPDGSVRLTGRSNGNKVFDANGDGKNFDNGGTTYRNGSTVNTNGQASGLPITGEFFTVTSPSAKTTQWRLLGNNQSYTLWDGGVGEVIFTDGTETLETQQRIEGYLAWKWGMQAKLPGSHPHAGEAPGSPGVAANLAGTVNDVDGGTPTTTWSVESGPGTVTFGNASSVDTTATFTATGTYVLSLEADDGTDQSTDYVTIIVNPPLPTIYATWAGGGFTHNFNSFGTTENQDGDSTDNLLEFAFGTDPTVSGEGILAVDGTAHGKPMMQEGASGGTHELFFMRRKDFGDSGSVRYTVQFSSDLVTFYDSEVEPVPVADSSSAPTLYQVVKVAYPASLPNGQPARFGRVQVEVVP